MNEISAINSIHNLRGDTSLVKKRKRVLVKVECMECGKKFSCGPMASPECPKCGSTDIDVRGL